MEDYANEFYQMLTRVDIHDSEDQLVGRFIAGLRPQFQTMLHQFDPSSVAEARQRALLVEQQTKITASSWTGNTRQRSNTTTEDSKTSTRSDTAAGTQETNKVSDTVAAAPGSSRPTLPNALRCYSCGERGHLQTACPAYRRRGLIANDKDISGAPLYDTEDDQVNNVSEEEVLGDTGTLLMLRRNCFAPKTSEPVQRTALFSSTCTVKGKVCRFVIDSGCSSNVVSEEVVRKLSLTTETHPHPYRLSWMQTGADFSISQRTLLTFSIGSF